MGNKIRQFADDGWALWIDGDDHSTVYLNEWINPNGKNYVDVGVRIYGTKDVGFINLYIPFDISADEIEDLSPMLTEEDVLRTLFNASGKTEAKKAGVTTTLRYSGKTISLLPIIRESLTLKKLGDGTIITIDFSFVKEDAASDEAYLIFRIPHKTLDEIFAPRIDVEGMFHRVISLIQSPIIFKKYGYSIRINESRLLPPELSEIEDLNRQRIWKVLVTISIGNEYEMNETTCYRIRKLETELNRNYAPEGYDCTDVITYQWVEEREADMKAHYSFYFVIGHSRISRISVMVYLLIVLFMGALGCVAYDILKLLFQLLF